MILLVDADSLAFRSFYALQEFRGSGGQPAGVVHGVIQSLRLIANDLIPETITFCWGDRRQNLWRRAAYEGYKANRSATPPEFSPQCKMLMELLDAAGIPQVKCPAFEADDVIAALTKTGLELGESVGILTADHDMQQLVQDSKKGGPFVKVYQPKRKGGSGFDTIGEAEVVEKWGVTPKQLPFLLAIRGEKGDGVPGIEGIGKVRARQYINGTASASVRTKIKANNEIVKRNLKLVDLSFITMDDIGNSVLDVRSHSINKMACMAVLKKAGLLERKTTLNTLLEFSSLFESIREQGAHSQAELEEEFFGGRS